MLKDTVSAPAHGSSCFRTSSAFVKPWKWFDLLWSHCWHSVISNLTNSNRLVLRITSPWLKWSCVCLLRGRLQMTPCVRFLHEPGFHRPLLLWIQKQEFGDRTEKATSCASQLVYDISVSSLHTRLLPAAGTHAHTLRGTSNTLKPELFL